MGTWDVGPFDNDTAADFSGDLDDAAESERAGIIRSALARVLITHDHLDQDIAVEAVAAAALVAGQCPAGEPVTTAYGPDLPLPELPVDLRELAVRALDRVVTEPSELMELWGGSDKELDWRRTLRSLRQVLVPAQPVRQSWARIDAWMLAHAPASYALLAPPADPAEIEAAQAEMGLRFPADLVESLACHDGLTEWANLLPDQPPQSIADILDHWRMRVEAAGDDSDFCEPDEESGEPWWHPQWIPWAQSHNTAQVIDMRDGPRQGRLGTAATNDTGHFAAGWPSLASYLTAVADALDHGGEVDGDVPYLTPQRELWWSCLGEAELNGEPLTPAPRAQPQVTAPRA